MRLIGAKYVSQVDIVNCIKNHVLDVVYNLTTWSEGPFRFDDNTTPGNDSILVPIELENVIIEASRRKKDSEEINAVIEDLDVSLRFPQNPKEKFKGVHLGVDEWKVVSYVNPKNSIRQIMKVLNMSEMEIKKVVLWVAPSRSGRNCRPQPTTRYEEITHHSTRQTTCAWRAA